MRRHTQIRRRVEADADFAACTDLAMQKTKRGDDFVATIFADKISGHVWRAGETCGAARGRVSRRAPRKISR